MYKRNNYKMYIIGSIALSVIALTGLIYAAFTGQLNITGTSVNRHSKWDVHFENLSAISTTHTAKVLDNKEPKIGDDLLSITDYDVSLTTPGDSISFTFDVVNEGNYNAKITDIVINTPECTGSDETSNNNVCKNIKYELTRSTGASIEEDEIVYAKDKLSLKVTLTYKDTVTADELATSDVSISNLGIKIDFEQSSDALVKDNGEVANYRVYHQGDKITLNNEHYWVIEDSGAGQDYVVALKDTPLTVAEVNTYGSSIPVTANNVDGYGGMAYGETEDYETSNVKIVIDAWQNDRFQNNELKKIDNYKAKLIPGRVGNRELMWNYGSWWAWTTSKVATNQMVMFKGNGQGDNGSVGYNLGVIRPFINVYKSALENNNG